MDEALQQEPENEDVQDDVNAEAAAPEAPETVAPELAPETVVDPLAAVTAERDALKDQMLRMAAEFDNFRKRTARESAQIRKAAAANLVRDLLPVLDNFERALAHASGDPGSLAQGVEMILKQLKDVLVTAGVEPITAVGHPFDPQVHEALTQQSSEVHPVDHVVQEFERGYRLGDLVLRAAKVVVSSGPPEGEAAAPETEGN